MPCSSSALPRPALPCCGACRYVRGIYSRATPASPISSSRPRRGGPLVPPTLLMGATLPAVARGSRRLRGVSWLGFFYGGNIAGAVSAASSPGFICFASTTATASYVAVAFNVARRRAGVRLRPHGAEAVLPSRPPPHDGESGDGGMGHLRRHRPLRRARRAEVIWTRILSLLFGATVYTFSIILAVFLIGLGHRQRPPAAGVGGVASAAVLGICQALLGAAITWGAFQ